MKTMRLFLPVLLAAFALVSCGKNDKGDPQYAVTVTAESSHGMATADKTKACEGDAVTLTAIPAEDYVFVEWTVIDGSVALYPGLTSNPATFTMPAADVKIKAEFAFLGVIINGVIWSEFNVNTPGTFTATTTAYGCFYQWNRKTAWLSTGTVPVSSPTGETWNSSNSGAEGDVWEPINDPCPEGWRVPTKDEHAKLLDDTKVDNEWVDTGVKGYRFTDKITDASIFFPASGVLDNTDGAFYAQGVRGFYWSANSHSTDRAHLLDISINGTSQSFDYRPLGSTVRCVR